MDTPAKICERCFTPISPGEPYVRYAHVHHANLDGSIEWTYAYVHIDASVAERIMSGYGTSESPA